MKRALTCQGALVALLVLVAPACDELAPLGRFLHQSVPRDVPALAILIVNPTKLVFDDSIGMRDAAHQSLLAPGSIFQIATDTFFAVPADKHDRVVTVRARENGAWVERPNAPALPAALKVLRGFEERVYRRGD